MFLFSFSFLLGGGGGARGGGAIERHRNDFFPITFIVHNQKSNRGGGVGQCRYRDTNPVPTSALHFVLFLYKYVTILYTNSAILNTSFNLFLSSLVVKMSLVDQKQTITTAGLL